jgi:ribose transport system permease protein
MSKSDPVGARGVILHVVSVWHLVVLLFLLIGLFAVLKPDTFLTVFTFRSMANSRSINALVALAVMIPLAANRFDLSAASIAGIGQVLANGLQTQQQLPWPLACLVVLAIGAAAGLFNGLLVTRFRIDSFISTLGTGTVLLGINQWYTGGQQVVGRLPAAFLSLSAIVPIIGLPAPLIYVLLIGVMLWLIFDYTPAGRYLYVIGDNPRAAVLSGLRVNYWVTLAFIGSGLVAAFAGIILQAQMQVGQSTVGQELMLPAFTGALLGATAVRPGRPNVWGTILAVAVLAIAVAGLSQLGAPFYVEPLFNGGMLIIAVGLAVSTQSRREREAARREMERRTQGRPSTTRS